LRALDVEGAVRSPTFTLVEPYETTTGTVHHLDLYRLRGEPAELDSLGYRDIRGLPGLVIVEWPERAGAALGDADLLVLIEHRPSGRRVRVSAATAAGLAWQGALRDDRI